MRAARALLRWSVEDLAKNGNVSVMTVRRAEANDGPVKMLPNNLAAICAALESAGVEFTNGNAPGVKLHKPGARAASIPLEDLNAENDE
jgi:transcriptional regulator with XRE-family HTH domain